MIYVFPFGSALLMLRLLFCATDNNPTRWIGGTVIFLGTVCFILYLSGITGIGFSEQLVKWFEKAGVTQ